MRRHESVWLCLGVIAATMFITRMMSPNGLSEDDVARLIDIQPMIELIIIILCLLTLVPSLLRKIKTQTIQDLCVWICVFTAVGIAIFMLPSYIPATATKDETDTYTKLIVYGIVVLVFVIYLIWESHKAKKRKKLNDESKAESDLVHQKAMEESK